MGARRVARRVRKWSGITLLGVSLLSFIIFLIALAVGGIQWAGEPNPPANTPTEPPEREPSDKSAVGEGMAATFWEPVTVALLSFITAVVTFFAGASLRYGNAG